nr:MULTISPECIES: adenosylcobinamide-phosphate synthase CbiB [unclassified Fusibacter]
MMLDAFLGDPIYSWHPVRLIGLLIGFLDRKLNKSEHSNLSKLALGAVLVISVILVSAWVYTAVIAACLYLLGNFTWVIEALLVYQLLATRCLYDEGARILKVIASDDLKKAQEEIGYLVSRDTGSLTMQDIKKAAVETLTENITDAIVAPVFYYALFGLTGIVVYKAINTMDSMIAYKNDRYLYFGRAAAYLDDAANFIPARIAAGLIMLAALISKDNVKDSLKCYKAHRGYHASPNAGCTESAVAGALEIKLSGPTFYFGVKSEKPFIGYENHPISEAHIGKVMRYILHTSVMMWMVAVLIQMVVR